MLKVISSLGLKRCLCQLHYYSQDATMVVEGLDRSNGVKGHEKTLMVPEKVSTEVTHIRGLLLEEMHIRSAEVIWDYMLMRDTLVKSDLILVLGNNDVRVAEHASQLFLDGYANYLMFSGYLGNLTEGNWTRPEYEVFREVALKMGVPSDRILVEKRATNTGQNIRFSYEVLKKNPLIHLKSIILVQTPYMERRTYATFIKQWPEETTGLRVRVTSPKLFLRQYPNSQVGSLHDVICILLGCCQRILMYPAKGYQIPQEVPDNVIKAYNNLANSGLFERFLTKF